MRSSLCVAALQVLALSTLSALGQVSPAAPEDSDYSGCTNPNVWGLTYDDGPSPSTPALLDTLANANVKATFFIVGRQLENPGNQAILARAHREGHQIGIHTYTHPDLTTLSKDEVLSEVVKTSDAIFKVIGERPRYFRPPYGSMNDAVYAILTGLRLKVVVWNHDTEDWKLNNGQTTHDAVISTVKGWIEATANGKRRRYDSGGSGIISLEHDLWPPSSAIAPEILNLVIGSGFSVSRVADCVRGEPAYFYPGEWTGKLEVAAPLDATGASAAAASADQGVVRRRRR